MSSCRIPEIDGLPAPASYQGEEPKATIDTPPKKKLLRRTDREYSQRLRLGFQLAFLALNVWIGVQFYVWVRWAETAGRRQLSSGPPASKAGCPSPG